MATSAQITANQQNAQLSTGPKTPQGIAACKHNATRHGLTGKQIVLPGEDPAAYDQVRSALLEEHAPPPNPKPFWSTTSPRTTGVCSAPAA